MARRPDELPAVILRIIHDGTNGAYAVTRREGETESVSITFSISSEVWLEPSYPLSGERVILCGFRKTGKGWRALKARRPFIGEE